MCHRHTSLYVNEASWTNMLYSLFYASTRAVWNSFRGLKRGINRAFKVLRGTKNNLACSIFQQILVLDCKTKPRYCSFCWPKQLRLFRNIRHVFQSFEIAVLGPDMGVMRACSRQDDAVSHREFILQT